MKKAIWLVLLIVGLAFTFPGLGYTQKVIRVGDAGAFTGDAAAPCMEIYNSAQIAIDEWNEKGGIKGMKIEHPMGDDAMDPAQAVNVAQKFCADSSDARCDWPAHEPYGPSHTKNLQRLRPGLHYDGCLKTRPDGSGL